MSEKFKRVQLEESLEEFVSGGDLVFENDGQLNSMLYYVWSTENPDEKYVLNYNDVIDAQFLVLSNRNNKNKSDAEKLQILVDAGLAHKV